MINEFLTFALGPNENVLDQQDYGELVAQTTGFQKGLLPSPQLNKVLRQSAFVASALAELVAATLGTDVLDDGNRAAFVTKLTNTILALSTAAIDVDPTLAANSDIRIPSQKAVKAFVTAMVTGLLDLKGGTDCSANPNYPAASKGDTYYVTVAGKIGGGAGKNVDVSDVYVASADNAGGTEAAVGAQWFVLEHNLVGALLSANNLSDLTNAGTARANLGLGTAATQNVGAFDASGAAAAAVAASEPRVTKVTDATANRGLATADANKYVRMTNAGANTVTVKPQSDQPMPANTKIAGIQAGAGTTSFIAGAGVTINCPQTMPQTSRQFSSWTLYYVGGDEWDLAGDIASGGG